MSDRAPLEDPAYEPKHPPVNGEVPNVVAKWGAPSQVRWFGRYGRVVGMRSGEFWDGYFPTSIEHRGICCRQCQGIEDPAEFWDAPGCCHRATEAKHT